MPPMLVMLLAVTGLGTPAAAATNGFDPSFAREGIYRLDMSEPVPSVDVVNAAVMSRAGLVAAGSAGGQFALGGFDAPSPSFFNASGQVIVPFGKPSVAHAVAAASDALVAAGSAGDDFAVVTLAATGDLSDEQRVRTSFGAPAVAYGVVTMSGPRTLAVGTVRAGAGSS